MRRLRRLRRPNGAGHDDKFLRCISCDVHRLSWQELSDGIESARHRSFTRSHARSLSVRRRGRSIARDAVAFPCCGGPVGGQRQNVSGWMVGSPARECHEDPISGLPTFKVTGAGSTHGLRRGFKGRDFTATSAHPLRNIPLPHCSRVSQRQFCIIFFSKRRTDLIPSIKTSSSASFFRDNFCQRSEARVILRKPKNSCRISSNVKPSCRARCTIARR